MFIGVIPVVMLVALALGSFYLFAGQFATFIVTTGLNSELKSLEATNSAITHQFASQIQRGGGTSTAAIESLRQTDKGWANRQICVWLDQEAASEQHSGWSDFGASHDPFIPQRVLSTASHAITTNSSCARWKRLR